MQGDPIFLMELFVFSGAALVWGCYELWTVRPSAREKKSPKPGEPGHPEG